jgi:hypothetical protein
MSDPLERFSPATRAWFTSAFEAPTAVQAGAWAAASGGAHALVVAPTGPSDVRSPQPLPCPLRLAAQGAGG